MLEQIRALIGSAPAGYEWLEYVVSAVVMLFLVSSAVSVVSYVLRWIGGRNA